mgnify:FL=1
MPRFHHGFALLRPAARHTLLGLGCWLAVGAAQAQSPAHEEVARLLRAGLTAQAQQKAEAGLTTHPNDAQLRFLKGVAQSQRGQSEAASATFSALTQDFPELPEPYNNLAVLEAAAGRLDAARAALETALRLNPGYATAQQNLGDVYARLAGRAWARALELDPANPVLQPRLQSLQQLPATGTAR